MQFRRSILIVVAFVLLPGCVAHKVKPKPKFEVEFVSLESAQLEEVMNVPTSFILPLEDSAGAWSRAKLFFSRYLDKEPEEHQTEAGSMLVTNSQDHESYLFSIEQTFNADGSKFEIRCLPLGDQAVPYLAERNSHNIARFIRDGTLELELLTR